MTWRVVGSSVVVRVREGFSEVPVFRDLPAALDSESPLIAFPGPFCFQLAASARKRV